MKNALFPSLFSCLLISFLFCPLLGNVRADDLLSSSDSFSASSPVSNSLPVGGSSGSSLLPPDPDRGIVRSVHLEEAWVENAFYIHSVNQDQLSPGQEWSLSGEFDFAFNSWFGGEFDFPVFLLTYPLGRGDASFGPITLGIRAVAFQSGSDVSRKAGILSFEVEGEWWPTPQIRSFPGVGNELTPEMLWAFRYHRVYFQGIDGVAMPFSGGAVANTFLRTSTGRSWENVWATQIQVDFNSAVVTPSGTTVLGFSLIPEVAYFPFGDALLGEIGEGVSVYGPAGIQATTYALLEIEFQGY
ncbi:hypothetical protein [Leptospirillum ferriphilum]|uniref:Uncharacterized protein n=1 Tax=Leptospirillum ferriphilum YSK TaxID=1441628 RepID=A0A059XYB4_9BACT|nr:hypothetical protein [Leptospirillum ferriphilum]AIA31893.1 hypothetical protein Y981_09675 [Leptospirillum ferriphilum YSK]